MADSTRVAGFGRGLPSSMLWLLLLLLLASSTATPPPAYATLRACACWEERHWGGGRAVEAVHAARRRTLPALLPAAALHAPGLLQHMPLPPAQPGGVQALSTNTRMHARVALRSRGAWPHRRASRHARGHGGWSSCEVHR